MSTIPSLELLHENKKVFFAYRTMEENHERLKDQPDVPHRHEYFTILLVKNACGKHIVDYQEFLMKPKTVFFVAPGQVHQVLINGFPKGDIILFNSKFLLQNYINDTFIRNLGLFSETDTTPPLHVGDETFEKLVQFSAKIGEGFKSDEEYKFDIIASYLKLFLIECNKYAVPPKVENLQTIQSGKLLLTNFKALLDEKFSYWHKVNMYAEALNITSDYLNNVVKTTTGKTAKEFILERLVLEAKRMGVHTDLSNKEIAYTVGFDDPSHFSKLFKKSEGVAFSDFRKSLELELQTVR